jgi:hypothetical protein
MTLMACVDSWRVCYVLLLPLLLPLLLLLQLSAGDYHDPSSLRQQRAGGNAGPMGVTSKDAANDRLAALEAELAREVRQ